ncbi:GNAT family N-acetyltransferase [Glutamicibacter sp. NPDC087344]|uniref:GNAT family N-acetyltransferase n=1 Tax=Glutamicibacter sp. NPDC087344 TaxID=3363994 RepID=UPI003805A27B
MSTSTPDGITLELITPELIDGQPSESWRLLDRAISRGFHGPSANAEDRKILTELEIQDGSRSIAAFDRTAQAPDLHACEPVGTYSYFPGTLNVGGAELVPVHQVTSVTVSPTHRRRGILRSMITEHLAGAAAQGIAVAVLTASEATIYGRFGFGVAAERARFELKAGQGAQFRVPMTGSVRAADPAEIASQVEELYLAHHRATLGSVSHKAFDLGRATARWEDFENLKPSTKLRAALHYNASGELDGFITYTFDGWGQSPATMSISTLCTVNAQARRELIAYLCDHDLVERVTGRAPVDDALPLALRNSRDYSVTAYGDHLWARLLNLPSALEARSYPHDARVVLQVEDDMGFVDGTWLLEARDGRIVVQRTESGAAEARILARDLATLYLGTRSANHLAAAGLLTEHHQGAADRLDLLFSGLQTPYCQVDF